MVQRAREKAGRHAQSRRKQDKILLRNAHTREYAVYTYTNNEKLHKQTHFPVLTRHELERAREKAGRHVQSRRKTREDINTPEEGAHM